MNIAFFHELNPGGARRCVNEFAGNLKKKHKVDLYYIGEEEKTEEKTFYSKVFFYKFVPKYWAGKNWKVRLYKDTIELYKLYLLHKKLAKVIDQQKYDIVIVNPSQFTQAPFLLRLLKSKKIYYGQEPLRIVYDSLLSNKLTSNVVRHRYEKINRWFRKMIDKRNYASAEICIAPSKYRAKLFSEIYHKPVSVVYCGVNAESFRMSDKKKDIDLLYIGSRNLIDGYDTFCEALTFMKNPPKVRAILTDEEWISGDGKLRDIYQRSRILVCTARKEGLGLATLEAMACGVAIVAVSEAGHKETVVNGKTGFLVPRNSRKIAEKLEWLLSNQSEAIEMGINGRKEIVEKWTWARRAKELENLIITNLSTY